MVIEQKSSALQTGITLLIVDILKQPNMKALALLGAICILTAPTVCAQTRPELEWEKGSCGYLHKDKTLIAGICGVPNGDRTGGNKQRKYSLASEAINLKTKGSFHMKQIIY